MDVQNSLIRILRSPRFFAAVVALFVIESVWIAVSAAYPGVFDENSHFHVIQIYAHQWSPFISSGSTDMNSSGALFRDPSYLYHYLMSFPYRLISLFTHREMIQVVALRAINIGLFAWSLLLFRKLLLKTRVSPAIINLSCLLFILIPVVPLLAAQINYDNLIMPLAALALLWATDVADELRAGRLPLAKLCNLLTLSLFASLVQYEFLPILTAVTIWTAWQVLRAWRRHPGRFSRQTRQHWRRTTPRQHLLVLVPLLVAIGLFVQMYGLNLLAYHNLTPQCHQILTVEQCAGNGSWARNQAALDNKPDTDDNPLLFTASWTYRLFVALFYTSSGGAGPQAWYQSVNPLPTIFIAALLLFAVGVVLLLVYWRPLLRDYPYLGFLLSVALLYGGALWLRNYHDFYRLGIKIAMNGRYLFPVMPPVMVGIALAYRRLLAGQRPQLRMALVVVVLLLFLQGGGTLTYITYSNSEWYWQNGLSVRLNAAAQRFLRPLIVLKSPIRSFGRL